VIIDTSAVVAMVAREDGWQSYFQAIGTTPVRRLSAADHLECLIVLHRRNGPAQVDRFRKLTATAGLIVEPVDIGLANSAYDAFRRYGKGIHPAGLNVGDCFAYALAKQLGEPLLFKGADFAQTDVTPGWPADAMGGGPPVPFAVNQAATAWPR